MRSQGGFTTVQLRGVKYNILQRAIKKRNAFAGECKSIFPLRDIHIKTEINDETQQGSLRNWKSLLYIFVIGKKLSWVYKLIITRDTRLVCDFRDFV